MSQDSTDYRGMTVNERLFVSGRFKEWTDALAKRDRDKMMQVLMTLSMNEKEAAFTVDSELKKLSGADPKG